jgi:hypothetical protein
MSVQLVLGWQLTKESCRHVQSLQNVQRGNALAVADSLITALQLSRGIVNDDDPARTEMDLHVQEIVTK